MKDTFGSQGLKIICCELEFGGEGFFQDPDYNSLEIKCKEMCVFSRTPAVSAGFGQETLLCWLWVKTPNSKGFLTDQMNSGKATGLSYT